MSEMLTPADRAVIEQAFAMPVIDSFVSTEGLVGHGEPGGSVMRFAADVCPALHTHERTSGPAREHELLNRTGADMAHASATGG